MKQSETQTFKTVKKPNEKRIVFQAKSATYLFLELPLFSIFFFTAKKYPNSTTKPQNTPKSLISHKKAAKSQTFHSKINAGTAKINAGTTNTNAGKPQINAETTNTNAETTNTNAGKPNTNAEITKIKIKYNNNKKNSPKM